MQVRFGRTSGCTSSLSEDCGKVSVALRNRQLVIELPEQLLPEGVIYASSENRIYAGRCVLRAGKLEREVAIGYLPQEKESDLGDSIADAVVWNAKEAPLALLALLAMDRKNDFMDQVCALCGTCGSIEEKNKATPGIQPSRIDGIWKEMHWKEK